MFQKAAVNLVSNLSAGGNVVLAGDWDEWRLAGDGHVLTNSTTDKRYRSPTDFTLSSDGSGDVTLNWLSADTLTAGDRITIAAAYVDAIVAGFTSTLGGGGGGGGAVTIADGGDVALGARNAAVASAYDATTSMIALQKRELGIMEGIIPSSPSVIAGEDGLTAVDAGNPLSVQGTVAVTGGPISAAQSGAWNLTNITGTVSLPTGAATEASLVKLPLTQGDDFAGKFGPMVMGAVTTAAPAYTTAKLAPLSLTTGGALRVDIGAGTISLAGTFNTTRPTLTSGNSGALQVTQYGELISRIGGGAANTLVDVATSTDGAPASAVGLTVNARASLVNASPAWENARTIGGATSAAGTGVTSTAQRPHSSANGALVTTAGTALADDLVLKTSAGNLYSVFCQNKATAGYLFLFDATTQPGDGAVTPKRVWKMAADSTIDKQFSPPLRMATGAVLVYGSGTDPFTLAASATAFLAGEIV